MNPVTDLGATLTNVLSDLGPDWLESRAKLLATLRERVPGETRAIHVLMAAFDAGVPGRLASADGKASDFELGQETAQVVDNFGSSPDHARAAVETWATALGRMSSAAPSVADAPPVAEPAPTSTAPASDVAAVQPLPVAAAAVQPLPPSPPSAAIQPLPRPVQPLPGAGPAVQPLPGAALPGVQPLPLPGAAAAPAARPAGKAWKLIVPAVALVAGGLWWIGSRKEEVPPPAPERPSAPPRETPAAPQAPSGATGRTDEGYAIATPDNPPAFPAKRIDGDPNTILFTFGLRFGADTYTYQAAAAFAGASRDGIGLVKAFKSGREAATAQLKVSRALQSNGYVGFTMAGPFTNSPIAAPPICVSALAGKNGDALDVGNGGGTFCAFGVTASGLCDGDRRLGCGDLTP